jgi:hypothetical protein
MAYTYEVYPLTLSNEVQAWTAESFSDCISPGCTSPPRLTSLPDGSLAVGLLSTTNLIVINMLAAHSSTGYVDVDVTILPLDEEGRHFRLLGIGHEVLGLSVSPIWYEPWRYGGRCTRSCPLCMCGWCRADRGLFDGFTTAIPHPEGIRVHYRVWERTRRPVHRPPGVADS